MKHPIKKGIPLALLAILFTATNLLALAPKPKPESLPEQHLVLKVIDGDTIDILYHGKRKRIRLLRINTPERKNMAIARSRKH